MANLILRTGITPLWGLQSGTSEASKACAMLLTSANISSEISDYEQLDSEGRKCGYLVYDNWQTISISGNIIFDPETDNFETISDLLTVGSAVTDSKVIALLDLVRTIKLNGTECDGDGTYVCKSFTLNQTNTDAATFDAEVTYYGFSNATA